MSASNKDLQRISAGIFLVIRSKPNSPFLRGTWALHRSHGNKHVIDIDIITKFLASLFLEYSLNHLLFHPILSMCKVKGKGKDEENWTLASHNTRNRAHVHSLVSVLYLLEFYGLILKTQGFQCHGRKWHHSCQVLLIESHADWPALVCSVESKSAVDTPLRFEQYRCAWI